MANQKYTAEHIDFIRQNIAGCPFKELTEKFNAQFGFELKTASMATLADRYGLHNGRDVRTALASLGVNTRFKPGQVPHNKGKKGFCDEGAKATHFKKGNRPWNWKPVGTERVNTDGYVYIKIADPNKWKQKHHLTWEAAHGPIPKGHNVIFGDGNRLNVTLDNLILVTNAQMARLNQNGLIQNDADLTRTGVVIADLITAISSKKVKKK